MVVYGAARCAAVALSLWLTLGAGQAVAQENLDAGKKPAELFATDCRSCHKSPVGLSKAPGLFGLESFLREHYTASRQTAAAIAGYLQAVDAAQAPPRATGKRRTAQPRAKSADKPKRQESKPQENKPAEANPAEANPAEARSAESKSEPNSEPKGEPKTDAKAAADKPAEPKASVSEPAEAKPVGAPSDEKDKSD
jgi:hypothetical protein